MKNIRRTCLVSLALMLIMLLAGGTYALAGQVAIPSSATVIDEQAFQGDTSITEVVLPSGLKRIEAEAFQGCSALEYVLIPQSVEFIADNAFDDAGDPVLQVVTGSYAWQWAMDHGFDFYDPDGPGYHVNVTNSLMAIWNGEYSNWVGDVFVTNLELAEGESVSWSVEPADEASAGYAELFFDPVLDEGLLAGIRAGNLSGEEGTATYIVKAEGPDGYTFKKEIEVTYRDFGDAMPTGLDMPELRCLTVGDSWLITTDDFEANGTYPEELYVQREFGLGNLEEIASLENREDGSVLATFTTPGVASFDATMYIGGVQYTQLVTVCVDANLIKHSLTNAELNVFPGTGDPIFVGDFGVDLDAYVPSEGKAVEWSIAPIDENQIDVGKFYFEDQTDNGTWVKLYAHQFTLETGTVRMRATATFPGGVTFHIDFDLEAVDPEAPEFHVYVANEKMAIWNGEYSNWVGDVYVENCDLSSGGTVEWTVEPADEESAGYAELFFDPVLNEGLLAGIRARNFSGAEGTATYVVKADAPGGYHYEEEFKVTFADYGEILPDGVSGPDGILTFNVGDTLTVSTDDIVANGSIPEGLHVHKEFYVDELKEIAEWETLDDGSIRFTFTEAGTAAYGYAMFAGGVEFSCNVAVCVESSLIHHHLSNPILLTNWNGDSSFVGDFGVDLDHYLPADGEAVQWTVEPIDNEQPDLAEFYFKDMTSDENGVWMKLYADTNMFAEEGGTVQLRATATFPCGTVFDIEFSVEVVPLEGPWAQPSAYAEQRIYNWQKGEPFTANLSDISVLREENIPEGVDYQLELLPGELENLSSFQWGEDHQSFTFTPEETGLYRYEAALNVAGMQGIVPINVIVEETPFIYYSDYPTQVVNRKQGDTNQVGRFVLDVGIHGLIEEEVIEWSVAPVDDQQPELAQFEMDASGYSDGSTAHLKASSFTGAEGTVQLRVTAKFPGGTTFDYDVQVEVVDIPDENLPEAGVPAEVVYLDVGETYRLNVKDLYIDGDVPEGINTELWIDPYLIEHLSYEEYQYDASEGCFKDMVLTIANAGVYNFDVVLDFGGMSIPKRIILFVGPMVSCYLSDEKIFANCEEGAVSFVGDFGIDLEHYQPKDGEAFVWTVAPIDENQPQLADFYFVDQTDNGTWMKLYARNFTGHAGDMSLLVTATFPGDVTFEKEITVTVTCPPRGRFEQINEIVAIHSSDYSAWIGDVYVDNLELAEGEEVTWTVEHANADSSGYADLFFDPVLDSGLLAGLRAENIRQEGTDAYIIKADGPNDFHFEQEFEVTFKNYGEAMPEFLNIPEARFFTVGDTFVLNVDDLNPDREFPEELAVHKEFGLGSVEEIATVTEQDDGTLLLTFTDSGIACYDASMFIGGVQYSQPVTVCVDQSLVHYNNSYPTLLMTSGDESCNFVGDFGVDLDHFVPSEGKHVLWSVEPVDETQPDLAEFYFEDQTDNGTWVKLYARNATGENGTVRLCATASYPGGTFEQMTFDVSVISVSEEELPKPGIPQNVFCLQRGEEFTLDAAEFWVDGGVPEGVATELWFDTYDLDQYADIEWSEERHCFTASFRETGDFHIDAVLTAGGRDLWQSVFFYVETYDLWVDIWYPSLMVNPDAGSVSVVGRSDLWNYPLAEGETVEWTITGGEEYAEFIVEDVPDDAIAVDINARNFTGLTGDVTLQLTVHPSNSYAYTVDIPLTIVEAIDLSEIVVPQDSYELKVGETFSFTLEGCSCSDELPEDLASPLTIWEHDMSRFDSFSWTVEGESFTVTPDVPGEYWFFVARHVGGVPHTHGVNVIVTE